jgi:hypothetical protein
MLWRARARRDFDVRNGLAGMDNGSQEKEVAAVDVVLVVDDVAVVDEVDGGAGGSADVNVGVDGKDGGSCRVLQCHSKPEIQLSLGGGNTAAFSLEISPNIILGGFAVRSSLLTLQFPPLALRLSFFTNLRKLVAFCSLVCFLSLASLWR